MPGVGEPVAFTARCTSGPFCHLSVHVDMTLEFLLLFPQGIGEALAFIWSETAMDMLL